MRKSPVSRFCAIGSLAILTLFVSGSPTMSRTRHGGKHHIRHSKSHHQKSHRKAAHHVDSSRRKTITVDAKPHELDTGTSQHLVAATGVINCNGFMGSANLISQPDIIVTAFRVVEKLYDCKAPINSALACTFQIGDEVVPVKSALQVGPGCPQAALYKSEQDWAVLRLASPIAGVKPYRLPDLPNRLLYEGEKVILVTARSSDFFPRAGSDRGLLKGIGDCEISDVRREGVPVYFSSNCSPRDADLGAAVLLRDLHSPTLVGISVEQTGLPERNDEHHSNLDRKTAGNVPLNAGLLAAIVQAAKAAPSAPNGASIAPR
jgi:hypothetical protein